MIPAREDPGGRWEVRTGAGVVAAPWWRVPALLVIAVVLVRTANVTGFDVADRLPLARVDPAGVWAPLSVHHLVQVTLTLAVMGSCVLATGMRFADFGFTTRRWTWSVSRAAAFVLAWVPVQLSFGYLFLALGVGSTDLGYPLTTGNVVGRLAFSAVSGAGEEPMYRGVVMTLLVLGWAPLLPDRRRLAVAAIAGSTLVFMIDHIGVRSLTVDPLLEATVLVAGIAYGWMFWRTRSLVGPIIAHGLLNVVIVTTEYWFALTM